MLGHIKDVDTLLHVVKCFDVEPDGPTRDIETIDIELMVADAQTLENKIARLEKKAKGCKETAQEVADCAQVKAGLEDGVVARKQKLNEKQIKGLETIRNILESHHGTGVQDCIEQAIYKQLDRIVVYPVEDEHKFTDHDGNVLPDVYLMPRGANAKDLAYKVHTELGDKFIRAIDARTKRVIGGDHELKNNDIIKIVTSK